MDMVKVKIDGQDSDSEIGHISTMADLVEFVKASIDPDTIIVDLKLEGRELSDADWRVPLSVQGDSVLEVTTGSRDNYVTQRLSSAPDYMYQIKAEFEAARTFFKDGSNEKGNTAFKGAIDDLRAFLGWYSAVLSMLPDDSVVAIETFNAGCQDLTVVCEQLVQQQLYQSWWALGETIASQLEPKLQELKEVCDKFAEDYA